MPMIRAMRLLNAIEAGKTSGAQLQALLTADPGRLAEFNVLLGMRGQMRRMAASSTAMTAVAASSAAKMSIFKSDTALAAIAASTTALTAMRAATTYVVQSVAVSGSTTIPNLNAGGSYILLGISSSDNPLNGNPIGVTTRRTGSTRANSGLLIAANATTATTTNLATPLVAPFNGTDGGGTGYTWYFGLLRCDV